MSSAYGGQTRADQSRPATDLGLPVALHTTGSGGRDVVYTLDVCRESDAAALFSIFADIIEQGQTYPQDETSLDMFRSYFLSGHAFVVRATGEDNKPVAAFYIKSNFPGRSAHLANYGLIVHTDYRGQGIANFMVANCIELARKLGFRALYTNLVYASNVASIRTCVKHGFQQVGRVPRAGNLKGLGYVDALQFYLSLEDQ